MITDHAQSAAPSPCGLTSDGARLVVATGGRLTLHDGTTGAEIAVVGTQAGTIVACGMSADGTWAVSAVERALTLWYVAGRTLVATLPDEASPLTACAVAPDGRTVAAGTRDGGIAVREASTGRQLASLTGHTGPVTLLVFSPDGRTLLSGSQDRGLRLWDLASRTLRLSLAGHGGPVLAATFSPDGGRIWSIGADRESMLWHAGDGRRLESKPGPPELLRVRAFAASGATVVVQEDGSLAVLRGGRMVPLSFRPRTTKAPDAAAPSPLLADENVQFTVYRPAAVHPATWYQMLAFAHLAERRPGESGESPVEVVERQARQVLGRTADAFQRVTQDSSAAVPREGELTFIPSVPGVEFNPRARSFLWLEDVHREEFRFRAAASLNGQVARGQVSVFLGSLLLADIRLAIRVDSALEGGQAEPSRREAARPYRKIFPSYSHRDVAIVREVERYGRTLGDRYLRDSVELRAGEVWSERLATMIEEADVFQLFWSTNSMGSPFVRREWEHALSLGRPHFVRPTYWEEPLPESTDGSLPPPELRRIQFERLPHQWAAPAPAALDKVSGSMMEAMRVGAEERHRTAEILRPSAAARGSSRPLAWAGMLLGALGLAGAVWISRWLILLAGVGLGVALLSGVRWHRR